MQKSNVLGRVFSLREAAAELRISVKKLNELAREFPFFTTNGNRKLFSEDDIKQLWNAKRSSGPATQSDYGAALPKTPSKAALYKRALVLTSSSVASKDREARKS